MKESKTCPCDFSGEVFAGEDVTTNKPQGYVTIESGKIRIHSSGSVTIPRGFEVKPGAQLEIATGN